MLLCAFACVMLNMATAAVVAVNQDCLIIRFFFFRLSCWRCAPTGPALSIVPAILYNDRPASVCSCNNLAPGRSPFASTNARLPAFPDLRRLRAGQGYGQG